MSNAGGPWGREEPEPPPAPRAPRGFPWLLVFLLALGGLIFALARAFPESSQTTDDWVWIGYYAGFLVLLATGVSRLRRAALPGHLRHAAIWVGVVAVLALGYAYRDELAGVPRHLRLAFATNAALRTSDHELVTPQDERGAFVVIGKVNGQRVRFVVDTGASDTVLSPADARRIGLPVDRLDYRAQAETANGLGYGAPYTADSLAVGDIAFRDFPMTVNRAPLSVSLLGLSFLDRLEAYEFRGRKLILKWRDPA
jgi:aspartyl protease family protein